MVRRLAAVCGSLLTARGRRGGGCCGDVTVCCEVMGAGAMGIIDAFLAKVTSCGGQVLE